MVYTFATPHGTQRRMTCSIVSFHGWWRKPQFGGQVQQGLCSLLFLFRSLSRYCQIFQHHRPELKKYKVLLQTNRFVEIFIQKKESLGYSDTKGKISIRYHSPGYYQGELSKSLPLSTLQEMSSHILQYSSFQEYQFMQDIFLTHIITATYDRTRLPVRSAVLKPRTKRGQ